MNLVEHVAMADPQRLDALLDQVAEWQWLGLAPAAASTPPTAAPTPEPTPHAGRKRARASEASPREPGKRRAQASMHHWQAEAAELWKTRAEAIAAASAGADKPTPSWLKRKTELQRLRAEVKQLEEQLQATRDGSAEAADARRRRERQRLFVETAWKLAAERALEMKQAALAENARLKRLVSSHLALSSVLEPALSQGAAGDLPGQARLQTASERAALFAAMEQRLRARLPHVEAAVQRLSGAARARGRSVDGLHARVTGGSTAHPVCSIQRSRTLPFGVEDVTNARWNCAHRGFPGIATRSLSVEVLSEDALGVDTIVDIPRHLDGSSRVSLHLRGVLKRWSTAAGSIVQFAGMTEWQTDSTAVALTEEHSWSVTRALRANAQSSDVQGVIESTLNSLGARMGGDGESVSDHWARRNFMETTVVPSIQHVALRIDQAAENALLDSLVRLK